MPVILAFGRRLRQEDCYELHSEFKTDEYYRGDPVSETKQTTPIKTLGLLSTLVLWLDLLFMNENPRLIIQ